MAKRRTTLVLGAIAGACVTMTLVLYCSAIYKQHEGVAFLMALSDLKMGTTNKGEFMQKMTRFKTFESTSDASSWYDGKFYQGVGYGIDNSTFGKYSMFPHTNLAAGIFFDSNGIAQGTIVTLDRMGRAKATMEMRPEVTTQVSARTVTWSERTDLIHLVLGAANGRDLTRLSVSCFTSWVGCDTAKQLVSLSDPVER